MAYEQRPLSGILFKNDKSSDNQPDYTGSLADGSGGQWRLAAWVREGKNGKFLSLKMSEPREATTPPAAPAAPVDDDGLDDLIPF
jgi:hypothetical protein